MTSTTSAAKPGRVREVLGHEVAHYWAHQLQERGRNASGHRYNFYFEGPTIYSYGRHFPIATFVSNEPGNRVVLFTTRGYSSTTSGHIQAVRMALPDDVQIIKCDDITPGLDWPRYKRDKSTHTANIARMLTDLEELGGKQKNARKYDYRGDIANGIRNLAAYVQLFKLRPTKRVQALIARADDNSVWMELAELRGTALEKARAERERRDAQLKAAQVEREREEQKERSTLESLLPAALKSWRKLGDLRAQVQTLNQYRSVFDVFNGLNYTALALTGDREEIITSEHAHMTVEEAKRIWPLLKARRAPSEIGGFRAVGFRDDVLVVGCHRIPYAELEYIARELGILDTPAAAEGGDSAE